MEYSVFFYILVVVVAMLYAAVGHGGASGYLALMGLWGISQHTAKPIALVLNISVSLIAFIAYYREGHFNKKLFAYLALGSVPMAYLGGLTKLDDYTYKLILGILLLIAASRMFYSPKDVPLSKSPSIWQLLLIGGGIGYLSGLIGIGGGILLSPLLLFFRWSTVKVTAGISALFIFVNSISVFFGAWQKGIEWSATMQTMLLLAIPAGFIGAWLGAKKIPMPLLKQVLAFGLVIASLKLLLL